MVVLSRILHDWDPPRCARLLRLAHSLLAPGGALLVAEMLLQDDRLGPAPVLMQVGSREPRVSDNPCAVRLRLAAWGRWRTRGDSCNRKRLPGPDRPRRCW